MRVADDKPVVQDICEALAAIVRLMVPEKHSVQVLSSVDAGIVRFRVCVEKADLGLVIGKQGQSVKALRTLLNSVSHNRVVLFSLQIVMHEDGCDLESKRALEES